MIKIDFNYQFVELDGTIIPERPPEMVKDDDGKMVEKKFPPFTLRMACINVLVMREQQQPGKPVKELTGEEKLKRYQFAQRIYNSKGLLDISPEEQVLLKQLTGRIYPAITVGQAWQILDPHEAGEKK